ncbi:MAG: hypothetical protein KA538_13970 [Azonexus sp.]|jgi:hypothetical protein|nr:hypothetical protein [Azonexus sp.]
MTRFAKPLLLETPCCQEKVMQRRFASVNSFGMSTRWSDGYTDIPMVTEASRLAYCPGCNKTYWLEDATELGIVPAANEKAQNRGRWLAGIFGKKASVSAAENVAQVDLLDLDFVDYHQHPRPADLLLAVLREEWSNPERELYLRTRLWWIGGHSQRGRRMASPMSDKQANENMLRLLARHQAVPVPDQDVAAIAELLRQLGRFDKAIATLEGVCGDSRRAHAIKDAAARGDSHVFEVETF